MIIGLSGYARSGKDEAAWVMVKEFDYRRIAFADKLRDALYALNPYVQCNKEDSYDCPVYRPVQEVIDWQGWDGYKSGHYSDDIRRLLQRLGTEAGRHVLGENVWVDAALTGVSVHDRVVVTDVRFPNEAKAIRKRGGIMVRVNRKNNRPACAPNGAVHESEIALDHYKFDYALNNNFDTVEEYHDHVRKFLDQVGEDQYFKHVIGD